MTWASAPEGCFLQPFLVPQAVFQEADKQVTRLAGAFFGMIEVVSLSIAAENRGGEILHWLCECPEFQEHVHAPAQIMPKARMKKSPPVCSMESSESK